MFLVEYNNIATLKWKYSHIEMEISVVRFLKVLHCLAYFWCPGDVSRSALKVVILCAQ